MASLLVVHISKDMLTPRRLALTQNPSAKCEDYLLTDPNGARILYRTLTDPNCEYFNRYDYANWKPPIGRRNWISNFTQDGEYLDIGCGAYPVSMDISDGHKRGVGLDISVEAVPMYKKYFSEFYLMDLEKAQKKEMPDLKKRFQTVIMSETLEHFRQPELILEKAKWFLKPNGRLLITYPNAFSAAQRVDRGLNGVHVRFKDFHRSHIYLVKKKKLEKLFDSAGFRISHFDYRPSDIVEGFPKENNDVWRRVCCLCPSLFGHQFFYVLEQK